MRDNMYIDLALQSYLCQTLGCFQTIADADAVFMQVTQLHTELQQRSDLAACLDAQLQESNELIANMKQAHASAPRTAKKQHKGKSGPAAVAGWVVKAGVTVGGTLLAGQAVHHYQAQQSKQ